MWFTDAQNNGVFKLDIGLKCSHGTIVYFNGKREFIKPKDLFWGHRWHNADVIRLEGAYERGNNTLTIYCAD